MAVKGLKTGVTEDSPLILRQVGEVMLSLKSEC